MADYQARIISLDPPIAHDGKNQFPIKSLPEHVKSGDWISVEKLNNSGQRPLYSFKEITCSTKLGFPGFDWNRMQMKNPQSSFSSRMEILRFRSRILQEIRNYFIELGLWEVETPVKVPSPGVETHLTAVKSEDWFLSPSPEFQMKRLLVGGSGPIFTITKSFRGMEKGSHHNPEFTMLEWYQTGIDDEGLRIQVEGLFKYLMESLDVAPLPPPPYKRYRVAEAFKQFANIDNYYDSATSMLKSAKLWSESTKDFSWEEAFFEILSEKIEPGITKNGPAFLTHWPIEFSSLSRPSDQNPKIAHRFEFFVGNLELANGFFELIDSDIQRARCKNDIEVRKASNKPVYPMDEKFLLSLDEGMPLTSGIALGIDRLVMLFSGSDNIEDVLSFSHDEL